MAFARGLGVYNVSVSRGILIAGLWGLLSSPAGPVEAAAGQQPDSTRRRDSAAVADSLRLIEELTRGVGPPPAPAAGQQPGPSNPRLLPDVSVVGDLVGDFSRRGSTQEDGRRFSVREIELAIGAAVDPYFRGDLFIGFNDVEKVAVEQAWLTATALPWSLELRLGRILVPIGKQNTTHQHDLHTAEYPWVIRRFLSPEGLTGTGVYASRVMAPFGFYQELQVMVMDDLAGGEEAGDDLVVADPINRRLSGLGYVVRFRNYIDLTQNANIELSASAATGKRAQPAAGLAEGNAVAARQSLIGLDFTYRWRPLGQGLYKSLILQGEVMRQLNERVDLGSPAGGGPPPRYLGPTRGYTGWYAFGRYQLSRRTFVAGRYDWLDDPVADGARLTAASGYLEFFPSEFSKLLLGYERVSPGYEPAYGRILLQAAFALGPHRPHPF